VEVEGEGEDCFGEDDDCLGEEGIFQLSFVLHSGKPMKTNRDDKPCKRVITLIYVDGFLLGTLVEEQRRQFKNLKIKS